MTLPLIWMIREPSDVDLIDDGGDTVKEHVNQPIESASLFSKVRYSVPVMMS